jgi:hypothetical protein
VKTSGKFVEEDGKYLVRVVGKAGTPRMNANGEFLGIKDLVSEMKESDIFARAFEGSGTSGGGSPANSAPARGGSFVLSRADAKDPMKYRAAREAAAKAGQELQIAPE